MRQRRRVGIIGAGWVTQYHLPAWAALSERAEVVAIADPHLAAAQAKAEAFGIEAAFSSAVAMLEAEDLDIVDICAPREYHAELVRLAAAKGSIDILCQKPLATTLPKAEALLDELSGAGRLMVHENWRFRPWYRRLKQWLDAGLAGDIQQVQLDFLSSGMIAGPDGLRPALVRQPFFARQERLLVMEVLIHQLDSLRYLIGEMEVVAARLERSNNDIIAEDIAAITLRRLADGGLIQVTGNLAVHGMPSAPRDQLRIFGTTGSIYLDGNQLTPIGSEPRKEQFDSDAGYQGSYTGAITHFLDCLDAGTPFETSPDDNLRTLRLVEDVYRLAAFDPAAKPR